MGDFLDTLSYQDQGISESRFLDSDGKPIEDKLMNKLKIYEALEDPAKTYFLELNGEVYNFDAPTIDAFKEAEGNQKSEIAESLDTTNMSQTHENTLKLFLSNVELFTNNSEGDQIDQKELHRIIHDSLDIFDEKLADKQIFFLYARKMQLEKDIAKMEQEKAQIDKRAQFRTNVLFSSIFTAFLAEFLTGYYCIYEVEWLGWDLVEPVTYTIGQGKFVLGTWFFWKYLSDSSCTDLNDFFTRRFATRIYKKCNFEYERLDYYKEQLNTVNQEIENVEHGKLY